MQNVEACLKFILQALQSLPQLRLPSAHLNVLDIGPASVAAFWDVRLFRMEEADPVDPCA